MKTKMVRVLSLIMSLSVTLSLIGCNKPEVSSKSSTGLDNSATQAQAPAKVTFFARFTNIPSDTHNDPVIKALEKATNLDITFIANPSNNYQERLQIMLASSDYPDLVSFQSHTDKAFLDAVNNGVVVPINKYLEKAPELYKCAKDMSWDAMKVKGDSNIYGVPQATAVRFDGYIIRKDWTDKLGITIPADGTITQAEFENIMKRMTKEDPDGNGRNDTFGLVPGAGSNGEIGVILNNTFGLRGWQKYQNEDYTYMNLMYSKKSSSYKEALAFTSKMFQEGYIDKSWSSNKGTDIPKTRFKQGIGGMIADFSGYTFDFENALKQNFPKAECSYITGVKDKNGEVRGTVTGTGYWWLSSLTTTAKGKEQAIINYLKYVMTDGWDMINYGIKDVHYTINSDGSKSFNEAFNTYTGWRGVFKLVMPADDLNYWIPNNITKAQQDKVRGWLKTSIGNADLSLDAGYRPAAADLPEFVDYTTKMNQIIAKIIVGELPVSAWDACLDGWYKAGGEQYVKQMNEYISKQQKK